MSKIPTEAQRWARWRFSMLGKLGQAQHTLQNMYEVFPYPAIKQAAQATGSTIKLLDKLNTFKEFKQLLEREGITHDTKRNPY